MTPNIFKYSLLGATILVACVAGAWYFFAAPQEEQLMRGHIEGTTLYPSEFIPAQRVCAQSVTDTTERYCIDTTESSGNTSPTFRITVPPGTYHVYASLKDASAIGSDLGEYKAYYTAYVTCGLEYACKDHTKLDVSVAAGQTITNIRPHDWYMP
jgi:hypothetical protein